MTVDINEVLSELLQELEFHEVESGSNPALRDLKAKARVAIESLSGSRAISTWERLPGPDDTDLNGLCWWWVPGPPSLWVLAKEESPESATATHWLPFDQLPQASNFTG